MILREGQADESQKEFLKRLRPARLMPITFQDDIAYERKLVEFITLRHPLAGIALRYWREQHQGTDPPVLVARLRHPEAPPGRYYFFAFSVMIDALRREARLVPVVVGARDNRILPEMSGSILRYITEGEEIGPAFINDLDPMDYENAKKEAIKYMAEMRKKLEATASEENEALINARATSLEQTYAMKRNRVERYLTQATEPRIRRMRAAQIANLEMKFKDDLKDLNERRDVTVTFGLKMGSAILIEN